MEKQPSNREKHQHVLELGKVGIYTVSGGSAGIRINNWMIEHVREIKIISSIFASVFIIIYINYSGADVPEISWIFVMLSLLALIFEAMFPANKIVDKLLKIPSGWISMLNLIALYNSIYSSTEIIAPKFAIIGHLTYFLTLFYIMFQVQRWFDRNLKDPNNKSYKRGLVMILNVVFIVLFIFFSLFIGMWVDDTLHNVS